MSAAAEPLSPRRVKLRPPRLPEDVVIRPRLLARLSRMATLSLIIAPAGYGKTTLVSSWLAQTRLPCAWLSLDQSDDEPGLFLAALAAAMANIFPGFGANILEGISSPHTSAFADMALKLINQLNELSDDFILVLDDYHVIHEPLIHQLLIDLVTYPPFTMHLVVTTRHDPPLPWRVRNGSGLCELRAADLSFTVEEAAQFFAKLTNRPIGSADTRKLVEQSQGWITSLRLTGLAMRSHAADARWSGMANAAFGDFSDYFDEVLLADLAPRVLSFLLRTSVLDPLCGALCDFVIAGDPGGEEPQGDSAAMLRTLERAGAFMVALDDEGTWYRCHPLLRDVLRRRLEVKMPKTEIAALYGRASIWLEEYGLYDEALAYALASGEVSHAVAFVHRRRHQFLEAFDWRRIERWLQQFPPAVINRHAELLLTRAWISQWRYNLQDSQADLDCVEALLAELAPDAPHLGEWRGETAALRSQQYVAAGDTTGASAAAQLALANLPSAQFYARSLAAIHLVIAYQMAGQWEQANAFIDDIGGEQGPQRDMAMARGFMLRAYINLPATNLTETRRDTPAMLQIFTARGLKTPVAWAHHFWACASYLQNDLQGAAEHFGTVLELVDHAHTLAYAHSSIGMALIYQARGLPQEARGVVEGAKKILAARQQMYALGLINAFAADLAARQGRIEEALRWVAREGRQSEHDVLPMFYVPGLAFVRVLLASGTPANLLMAEKWLERQMDLGVSLHSAYMQIQCYTLAAAVREAQGNRAEALVVLARALTLAEHGQVVRVFVDLARMLAPLFDALSAGEPLSGFAARVHNALQRENKPFTTLRPGQTVETALAAAPKQEYGEENGAPQAVQGGMTPGQGTDGRDLRELLTYREMDVLQLLEQRLTNKEIAHLLGISTETVRQHTVNLFRKLNVGNRRQAIVVARSWTYFDERE